ncbi:polymer-forming cytoskeletal protein [Geothrix sp. 21YS21S-4]|uniref:bactofilin family protein n=1 Tax=Geothrix sp. 21YS21S-4 TaxID=3068889 RepID=UPI0027B9095F|nr:polymer-forming cytoskeletal protein [Geothrix sp. 21YS21S-4]
MFGRAKINGTSRTAAAPAATVLGEGSRWQGEIRTGTTSLRIEGELEGTILSEGHVTIAPTGHVRGAVHAQRLTVMGRAEGVFKVAGCLEILGAGWVEGEVQLETLVVDEGGTLMGSCSQHTTAPSATAPVEREPVPLVPRRDEWTPERPERYAPSASGTHDFIPAGRIPDRRF